MEERPGWVPDGVDVTVPNAARVYDYALGGHHNFAVDREFFQQAQAVMPGAMQVAHANRAFLGRAVRWLTDAGIRQFLDIGSGIPTLGNVHEAAQESDPDARVVYVDIDPVAVEQSKAMLAGNPRAGAIQGDLRQPEEVLSDPLVLDLIDFSEPVAVLLIAVLHFVPDSADPAMIIRTLGDSMVSGSYIGISHGTPSPSIEARRGQEAASKLYDRTPTPVTVRTEAQVRALLAGFELVEPGVVTVSDWRPDPDADDPRRTEVLAAVARRP